MSKTTNYLKVLNIPDNLTEDEIKIVFANSRRKGGGPINHVQLNRAKQMAVIKFQSNDAVDRIMSRGSTVNINGQKVSVKPYYMKSSSKKTQPKSDDTEQRTSDKVERTIKAKVNDVTRHKDIYVLYLNDPRISEGEFEEDTIMLNSLTGYVFITFFNAKDARNFCRLRHEEESNIAFVEMAIETDFNIYQNLLSLHVDVLEFSLKDCVEELQQFIEMKSGLKVVDIIFYDEPRSLVVEFSDMMGQETIEALTWLCSEEKFKGHHLFIAPVYKNNMLLVRNLSSKSTEYTLKRYLSSIGGGKDEHISVQWWQEKTAIVTFTYEENIKTVLAKKHYKLEGRVLEISYYYPCLTAETHAQYFGHPQRLLKHDLDQAVPKAPSKASKVTPKKPQLPEQRHMESSSDENVSEEFSDTTGVEETESREGDKRESKKVLESGNKDVYVLTDTITLKNHEIQLLHEINYLDQLEKGGNIKMAVLHEECALELKANNKTHLNESSIAILQKIQEIKSKEIENLIPAQILVLNQQYIQEKIVEKWRKKNIAAYIQSDKRKITLFYFPPTNENIMLEVVNSCLVTKQEQMNENMIQVFGSENGKNFLSTLNAKMNKNLTTGYVEFDIINKRLIYVGSSKVIFQLKVEVEEFMEQCIFLKKNVNFPEEKKDFVERFCKGEKEHIMTSLQQMGINIEDSINSWHLNGLAEKIQRGVEILSALCASIVCKKYSLNFVGIKEFLLCPNGKQLVENIESKHSCVISLDGDQTLLKGKSLTASSPRILPDQATTIATMNVNGCSIIFIQDNILNVNTDIIVNTVDSSYNCMDSLGKAIFAKEGVEVQRQLKISPEKVIMTKSGPLHNCKSIIHLVCPMTGVDIEELKHLIQRCLSLASEKQFISIAFAALSIGKIFKFPDVAFAKLLMEIIKRHLENEQEDTRLARIILCDLKPDNMKLLLDRCQLTFKDIDLNYVGELHEAPQVKHKPHQKSTSSGVYHAGKISVYIVSGEVTKEKSDIIVTTVDKSLNLEKGGISKAVLKYGGQRIQDELNLKYNQGITPGHFAVTDGGNLKCKKIFHACLSHYEGDDASQISNITKDILKQADSLRATSISIPALGTGGLNYPADLSSHAIMDSIRSFAKYNKSSSLKSINLVIHPKSATIIEIFKAALGTKEKLQASYSTSRRHQESTITINCASVKLTVKEGDITTERCHAIIIGLKENLNFASSGAVAKSVLNTCGSDLEEECQLQAAGFLRTGVMITSGFKLSADHIIYISLDKFSKNWSNGLTNALMEAEKQKMKSLAFPAFGAGKRRYDVDSIKEMVLNVVKAFGTGGRRTLTDIRLVTISREIVDAFGSQVTHGMFSSETAHIPLPSTFHSLCGSIDITIYSQSDKNCDDAENALRNACQEKYVFLKEQEKIVQHLNPKQITEMKSLGLRHGVELNVGIKESTISIQGFPTTEFDVAKLKKLREFDKSIAEAQLKEHEAIPLAFQWQFKSGTKWRDFDTSSNSQLERAYTKKSKYHDLEDNKGRKYRIDFKIMKESLLNNPNIWIDIRRVDLTKEEPLPKRWDSMDSYSNLKLVTLRPDSQEYRKVAKYFKEHGVTNDIKQIERVQNKSLYQQYAVKKRDMEARNPAGHKNEIRLFHGTHFNNVDAICQNGFDRNHSGVNATMYGTGVYFAVESSYSASYATADANNNKKIFQARVLVGESVATTSYTKFLPIKPDSNYPYDSGVDDVKEPSMYIIFHDAQAYPEYLISF